ncbi:MAG TPA: hypothetical protein VI942_03515 [Thermoanaerobaculia bacterium]|nr:hypothetical protein [Thermoanaerobaculia bacterium]
MRPLLLALAVCLSGLVAMPAIHLATDRFAWQTVVDSYVYLIFRSGFEPGDPPWSNVVGGDFITVAFAADSVLSREIAETLGDDGSCFVPERMVDREGDRSAHLFVSDCRLRRIGDRIYLTFRRPTD